MLEILKYSFFQNALIGGIFISIIAGILGVFIVLRKEANITHSISNFLFLGIAVSLFFSGNYYIFGIFFAIFASLPIYFIEKTKIISNDAIKEIIGNFGLAAGIFLIGFLENMTLDINNLLFGNILLTTKNDLIYIVILFILSIILFGFFGKNFIKIAISKELAKTSVKNISFYEIGYLVFLSIFIAITVKILGILLLGAFLIIPANIAKLTSKNLKGVFVFSIIFSVISVILGLFGSYFLGTSSGATIILILIIFFIVGIIFKKSK